MSLRVERYKRGRFWAVIDAQEQLVCLCVYRKGACEVARRLECCDEEAPSFGSQKVGTISVIREQRQDISFSQE